MELRSYINVIARRRKLLLITAVSVLAMAVAISLILPPVYMAQSKVLIVQKPPSSSALSGLSSLSNALGQLESLSQNPILTQVALAQTRPVVESVIKELDLRDRQNKPLRWNALLNPSMAQSIIGTRKLSVAPYLQTDLILIQAQSRTRAEAQAIANTAAKSFVNESLKINKTEATRAREFIGKELALARRRLEDAQNSLKAFQAASGAIDLSEQTKRGIERLSEIVKKQADFENEVVEWSRKAQAWQSEFRKLEKNRISSVMIQDNPQARDLKAKINNLNVQLASLKAQYTDDHPDVIETQAQIAASTRALATEEKKIFAQETRSVDPTWDLVIQNLKTAETNLRSNKALKNSVDNQLREYEQQLKKLPDLQLQLARLTLSENVAQDAYKTLLQKYNDAQIGEAMQISNARVVESALQPEQPIRPKKLLNAIVGLLLGLALGVGVAFLGEYLDDTVKSDEDVHDKLDTALIGTLPAVANTGRLVLTELDSRSPIRESLRGVRHSLRFLSPDRPLRTLVVTSPSPGEGKSTLAANLAAEFAMSGKKTLLIDADLRKPTLEGYYGRTATAGLADYLAGDTELADVIGSTEIDNLSIICSGPIPPNPGALLESNRMRDLVSNMPAEYDTAIIDTPPTVPVADASLLGSMSDGVILVTCSGKTAVHDALEALRGLECTECRVLGVVLNRVQDGGSARYQYYRHYEPKGENRAA